MKILQLCHKPPLPPVDGGCIAIHNITDGLLNSSQQVKVVAIETKKHPVKLESFPIRYLEQTAFESIFVDTTPRIKDAWKTVFNRKSYQISRFYSKSMVSKLTQVLKNETFDVIHLESIYVTPYIPILRKYSDAKIVLRMHNVEHQIWERMAKNECNPVKKMIYGVNASQLRHVEMSILKQVDGYMTISEPDFNFFQQTAPEVPGTVITFGLDLEKYEAEEDYIPSETPSLFHLGSMNWSPNVEGVEWFLDEVWPQVLDAYPNLHFTIAGFGIPDRFFQRHDSQVTVVGAVPSANEFMLAHDLMIVPLLSGSGIRIKIIEAMALGKVVITTSVGAEGLAVENGKHLFVADTPEEFVSVVGKCIATPDLCSIIGENARDFISVYHNNDVISNQIIQFYQKLIS